MTKGEIIFMTIILLVVLSLLAVGIRQEVVQKEKMIMLEEAIIKLSKEPERGMPIVYLDGTTWAIYRGGEIK